MTADYLDYVRRRPCCACAAEPPSEAHHYMEGHKGMGMKVSDFFTVPVCRACHQAFHDRAVFPCYEGTIYAVQETRILIYRTQSRLLAQWQDVF